MKLSSLSKRIRVALSLVPAPQEGIRTLADKPIALDLHPLPLKQLRQGQQWARAAQLFLLYGSCLISFTDLSS